MHAPGDDCEAVREEFSDCFGQLETESDESTDDEKRPAADRRKLTLR
jgi:hypothetical protein